MTGVLDMVAGRLPATATYAVREWRWVPCDPSEHPDGRIGELTITMQKAARNGRRSPTKVESDTYAVQRDIDIGVASKAFLLLNLTDPDQPDVYSTTVGVQSLCTCKAGQCRLFACKHRESLAAVIEMGGIE